MPRSCSSCKRIVTQKRRIMKTLLSFELTKFNQKVQERSRRKNKNRIKKKKKGSKAEVKEYLSA